METFFCYNKFVDNPKCCIPSAINQMNLATFCFWVDQAILGSDEQFAILLKYPTFEGVFFSNFHEDFFLSFSTIFRSK